MAGKGGKNLGLYTITLDADGNPVSRELEGLENKVKRTGGVIANLGKKIGENFQHWIKSGLGFNALLGGVRENLMKLMGAIADGVKRAAANNEAARKSFEGFGKGIENLFTRIGSFLLPILKAVTDAANKALNAVGISTSTAPKSTWTAQFQQLQARQARGIIGQREFEEAAASGDTFNLAKIRQRIETLNQQIDAEEQFGDKMTQKARDRVAAYKAELGELVPLLATLKDINAVVIERNKIEAERMRGESYMPEYVMRPAGDSGRVYGGEGTGGRTGRQGAFGQGVRAAGEGATGQAGDVVQAILKAIEEIDKITSAIAEVMTPLLDAMTAAAEEYVRTGDAGKALTDTLLAIGKKVPILDDVINVTEALGEAIDAVVNAEQRRLQYLAEQQKEATLAVQSQTSNLMASNFAAQKAYYSAIESPYYKTLLEQERSGVQVRVNQLMAAWEQGGTGDKIIDITRELYERKLELFKLDQEIQKTNEETAQSMQDQLDTMTRMLSTLANSGLIDVENYASIAQIDRLLTETGVSAADRLATMTDLGIKGANIGTVNVTVNEAQGQTVEDALTARLIGLFGGK